METSDTGFKFDPGSFRDPSGRVFHHDGKVFRTVSPDALQAFREFQSSTLLDALVHENVLCGTQIVDGGRAGLDASTPLLQHEKIDVISYPYEWSFDMLRDAALQTLTLQERCWKASFTLKDATAFNILFSHGKPIFIDIPSIEKTPSGAPWHAYGQFCRAFLYPLLVTSYLKMDVQLLLRSSAAEISLQTASSLLGARHWLRAGVFKDIFMQQAVQEYFADKESASEEHVKSNPSDPAQILKNIHRLRGIIEKLRGSGSTAWSDYEKTNSYSSEANQAKAAFVSKCMAQVKPRVSVDLGCNTGGYSELAAVHSKTVIAVDQDAGAINSLYKRPARNPKIELLVASLTDPSPALGWALTERQSLLSRLRGEFFLALALIHHLRITGNISLDMIFQFLADVAPNGIIEWINPKDPMVKKLLVFKPDLYSDCEWEPFQKKLQRYFEVVEVCELDNGVRKLCFVKRR